MLSEQSYAIAWAAYLISAGCIYVLISWLVWRWGRIGTVLRALLAVILFTPVMVDVDKGFLAPANLTAVFALTQNDFTVAERALVNFCIVLFLLILVYMIKALVTRLFADPLARPTQTRATQPNAIQNRNPLTRSDQESKENQ